MLNASDLFLEHAPAVLVALEHVEARACGRKQHNVARLCRTVRAPNGVGHVGGAQDGREIFQLVLDAFGVLAEEDERARLAPDERRERRVGRVLAATAEDENYPSRLVRE